MYDRDPSHLSSATPSTFTVAPAGTPLPLHSARAVTRPILVVDDDRDYREMLATTLAEEGYVVLTASDGKQALDLLVADGQAEPCLIVLDMDMPVMSGMELLATVSGDVRLAKIPLVIHSGSQRHTEALRYPSVVGFVEKPVDHAVLLSHAAKAACEAV
jgi:CheY-like chemotaxis protein